MTEENITRIVETYTRAWSEIDEAARGDLLETAWGDETQYTDPTAKVRGRDELVLHIGGFQQQWPGARIEMSSGVDAHHGMLRFRWQMVGADGAVLLEGMDFGDVGGDGRLQRIAGFFGPFPQ
jgi:hypothetical protein